MWIQQTLAKILTTMVVLHPIDGHVTSKPSVKHYSVKLYNQNYYKPFENKMIQNLQNLEAKEFIKGPAKGLPATPQVVVKGGKGETLFTMAWGDEYKSQSPENKGMTLVFVKTNNEKVALGLPKEKLASLLDEAIVQKKAPAKGSEQK